MTRKQSEVFEEAIEKFEEATEAISSAYVNTHFEGYYRNFMLEAIRHIEARLNSDLQDLQELEDEI